MLLSPFFSRFSDYFLFLKLLLKKFTQTDLVKTQTEKGWQHAQHFTPEKCAAAVMNVYQSVW